MDNIVKPSVTRAKFADARPDRFALAMGGLNLLHPMPTLRELTAIAADLPVAYAVVGPSFWGDAQYPPTDAVYYPLYTKCAELDLPLCLNTGCPGRRFPARCRTRSTSTGCACASRNWTVHDPRRRPLVGRRHPVDDQVRRTCAR